MLQSLIVGAKVKKDWAQCDENGMQKNYSQRVRNTDMKTQLRPCTFPCSLENVPLFFGCALCSKKTKQMKGLFAKTDRMYPTMEIK